MRPVKRAEDKDKDDDGWGKSGDAERDEAEQPGGERAARAGGAGLAERAGSAGNAEREEREEEREKHTDGPAEAEAGEGVDTAVAADALRDDKGAGATSATCPAITSSDDDDAGRRAAELLASLTTLRVPASAGPAAPRAPRVKAVEVGRSDPDYFAQQFEAVGADDDALDPDADDAAACSDDELYALVPGDDSEDDSDDAEPAHWEHIAKQRS